MLGNSGVIMAQCYGIILRFQGNGTMGSVEHPRSTDLSRMKCSEASKVIGSDKQGMGVQTHVALVCVVLGGQAQQHQSELEGFSLMMT